VQIYIYIYIFFFFSPQNCNYVICDNITCVLKFCGKNVTITGIMYVLVVVRNIHTYIASNVSTTTNIYIISVTIIFLPQNFNTCYIVTDYIITILWWNIYIYIYMHYPLFWSLVCASSSILHITTIILCYCLNFKVLIFTDFTNFFKPT